MQAFWIEAGDQQPIDAEIPLMLDVPGSGTFLAADSLSRAIYGMVFVPPP
jgi:hypothetical protein